VSNQSVSLEPFSIGKVQINPNLILAPMSGVTNTHFRRLIREENPGAVGLLVTEFISIEALTRDVAKAFERLSYEEVERPISIQIFGYDIDRMVEAAKRVEDAGADIVDINCGCPAPKVVKKGGGCELMRHPQHLAKMLSLVEKAVSIPLTLKIRSGWCSDSRNGLEIAKLAEDSGVQMLTIHGRTKADMYRGDCDWELIGQVAENLKIPVVGSGDVLCFESAKKALEVGVAGLMIGRGALQNPWIFQELTAAFSGTEYQRPSDLETVRVLKRYRDLLFEDLHERAVIGKMKQLTSQVTRRVRASAEVRRTLCSSKSMTEYSEMLDRWEDNLTAGVVHNGELNDSNTAMRTAA